MSIHQHLSAQFKVKQHRKPFNPFYGAPLQIVKEREDSDRVGLFLSACYLVAIVILLAIVLTH